MVSKVLTHSRFSFKVRMKRSATPLPSGSLTKECEASIPRHSIDSTGKVHERSSASHVYSHCVVIHLAAHPPSKLWPKGIAASSHAEWVKSFALAERKASRWRKDPYVEAIEILEARQV